MQSFHMF